MKNLTISLPESPAESCDLTLLPDREGRLRMVLDTDTYNEVDDQFALAQAVLSPDRLEVEAVTAAPFHNSRSEGPGDGMEKSYEEILRLLNLMDVNPEDLVFRGASTYLLDRGTPVESEAVDRIIALAHKDDPRPLYVVAIGAITNVASAILKDPGIVKRIAVVWIGGSEFHFKDPGDFNISQDVPAAQVVFDSGVPFVHISGYHVALPLNTTMAELAHYIKGTTPLGDYLYNIVETYGGGYGWSKVIWDLAATSWLINPDWVPTEVVPCPVLTDDCTYVHDKTRHRILNAVRVYRDPIFADVFRKIAGTRQ